MSEDNLEVVSQEMMDELDDFGGLYFPLAMKLFYYDKFPAIEHYRACYGRDNGHDVFLKILSHISGHPQFKAEKPKKWIVRTKETDRDNDYWYLGKSSWGFYYLLCIYQDDAHKFDTKEEAEKWTNPQCEVVEVEE